MGEAALGDLDQALDDFGACDLSLLVAGENRLDLLAEDLGLSLVGAGTTFDLALEQLLEQPDLDVGVLCLGRQRVKELARALSATYRWTGGEDEEPPSRLASPG